MPSLASRALQWAECCGSNHCGHVAGTFLPILLACPLSKHLSICPCRRAVDVALGSPVNSFVITARECTRALARDRLSHRPGLWSRLAVAADVYAVEFRMAALRVLSWLAELEAWLRGGGGAAAATEGQQAALAAA